jgi:Uma2 family endonuclease
MSSNTKRSFLSVADYLEGEKLSTIKHEYIAGDVYAMAGGSRNHNTLAFNLGSLIGAGLTPPCQGYSSNMKIQVRRAKEDIFYYPDLSVSCREEGGNDYYNEHPVLIIEVLSPSTERNDKYEKFLACCSLESMQEYVLVYQDIREIWLFSRVRQWDKTIHNDGEIRLESVGITLAIDAIYRNVRME